MLALTHSGLNCNTVLLLQTLGQINVVCFILFYQAIFCPAERELITTSIMKQSVTITFSIFIFLGGGGGALVTYQYILHVLRKLFFSFLEKKKGFVCYWSWNDSFVCVFMGSGWIMKYFFILWDYHFSWGGPMFMT